MTQEDGRSIFYPRLHGPGYWIESVEREAIIRAVLARRLRGWRYILILEFVLVIGGSIAPSARVLFWAAVVAIWFLAVLGLVWSNKGLTRGLTAAPPRTAAADPNAPGFLEGFASRQSSLTQLVQFLVLGAVAIYVTRGLITAGPSFSGGIAAVILWPLALIGFAGFLTRLRKRASLGGPSPEQLYNRGIWRPVWLVVIALFLIALIELIVQATHRYPPTREVSLPITLARFDKSLRITT